MAPEDPESGTVRRPAAMEDRLHPTYRVIALVNQKGGCGKTTSAVNLSASLALAGRKSLLVDLDPQANATVSVGVDPAALPQTIYHVLINEEVALREILTPTRVEGLWLAPASIDLAAAELELAARIGRENALRKKLVPVVEEFTYVVLDTPPSLGLLTLNALVACDAVIIPIQTHYYALLGMRQLLRTLKMVRDEVGHQVEILGVLPTMYDARTNISKEILQGIRDFFEGKVFETTIHFNIKLVESSMAGVPLFVHEPESRGAKEYMALAREVMARETSETVAGASR
jgi:chromosome partitioning protein